MEPLTRKAVELIFEIEKLPKDFSLPLNVASKIVEIRTLLLDSNAFEHFLENQRYPWEV